MSGLESACEQLASVYRSQFRLADADMLAAAALCDAEPMLRLIESYSDEYVRGVCESVRRGRDLDARRARQGIVVGRGGRNSPPSAVTHKQRHLLAIALLERHITARAAVAAAWSTTEEDVQRLMEHCT